MSSAPIVEVENLCHTYAPDRRGEQPQSALRNVTFQVEPGKIFGLLGPNGGGKTTLFKILSTLLIPTSGTARILGLDVRAEAHAVRRHLGVAFQSPSLDKKLTAEENLRHQGHLYGLYGDELRARIRQALDQVGLEDRARNLVESLSGGMFRRIELAKALLHRPELLLLDEPSTGLDPGTRRDLWNHLKSLQAERGVTVVLTTHLMEEAAGCDRLALLHQGQIVAYGTPEQLTSEIGGDVLTLQAQEPERLVDQIRSRFGAAPTLLDGLVRIECQEGHKFIPQLVEAFPGRIQGITLGKPTLEDVFIHRTGHHLWIDD